MDDTFLFVASSLFGAIGLVVAVVTYNHRKKTRWSQGMLTVVWGLDTLTFVICTTKNPAFLMGAILCFLATGTMFASIPDKLPRKKK